MTSARSPSNRPSLSRSPEISPPESSTYSGPLLSSPGRRDMDHDIGKALSNSALMAALTDRQRQQIASIAKTRSFGPGDVIVSEGSPGALAMWVVVEGRGSGAREGRRLNG